MKRILLFFSALLLCTCMYAARITFSKQRIDPKVGSASSTKLPIKPVTADLYNGILTFDSPHPAYTIAVVDCEGETLYEVSITSGVYVVMLPTTLSGECEIRLYPGGNYYFYSAVTL